MTDDSMDKLRALSIEPDARSEGGGGVSAPVFIVSLLAVAGLAGAGGFFGAERVRPAPEPAPGASAPTATAPSTPSPTLAATPRRSGPRGGLVASGYVIARRQATVSAEITGRIEDILVEEGAAVAAGEVLAKLDSAAAEIDLGLQEAQAASAAANVNAVAADLREAERTLARTQELMDRTFSTEADLDIAKARVDGLKARLIEARANAQAARQAVARAQDFLDRHTVRAPFSGVVIGKNAQAGEIVSPTSAGGGFTRTGIYTLVDMDSLEIEVDVNEGQIGRIFPGQAVDAVLDAYPDERWPARVAAIIPTANRDRATIQVRVAFERRDDRVLPDMAAKVTFSEDRA
ncbi:MAG: efflux RND transporter periplasmic adaptor subunit [Maricaulaceae bacterium]